jgi:hypothetical protein
MGAFASLLVAREAIVVTPRAGEPAAGVDRSVKDIGAVLLVAVGVFFLVATLSGVVAQHLPGRTYMRDATVDRTLKNYSGRNPCQLRVIASADQHAWIAKFCAKTISGTAIGPADLGAGDVVSIRLRATALGIVVESVTRAR